MSEQLHPGLHPDPDSLNAFIEGVLPEHDRLQCLEHLAECPRCREVVFLAQEPLPAPAATKTVPGWRRWLIPVPALAAVGVCVAVLAVWLYWHRSAGIPAHQTVARVSATPPIQAQPSVPGIPAQVPSRKPAQTEPVRSAPTPASKKLPTGAAVAISASTHDTSPLSLPEPPLLATPPGAAPNNQSPIPPALTSTIPAPPIAPTIETNHERATPAGVAGISGTVIDPTGALISGATIKLHQLDGTITADTRADGSGQFNFAGLPAGRYELQIGAPGFRVTTRQVDLHPSEVAALKSQLEIGSVAESVEVTAAVGTIQTANASVATVSRKKARPKGPSPLPGKLPTDVTVTSGKVLLAMNSGAEVFVSRNSGRSWKIVKPVWHAQVHLIALADPSQSSIAVFQLTTDAGSVWLSRDGAHWYTAPSQH